MSDRLFSNSLLMLERSMNFQWTKLSAINENIVNAETPNYKAKYVTFEEEFDSRLRAAANRERPRSALRSAISASAPQVHVASNESMRMDDNGVNVAEQEVEAVRAAYQMQYVMDSINGYFSSLRSVIRGQ